MTIKKIITILAVGVFTISTIQAQDKVQDQNTVKQDSMKMNHSEMSHNNMNKTQVSMELNKNKMEINQEQMDKVYTCSMHPEIIRDKSGECPKCGMELIEKNVDRNKLEDHKKNNCMKHNH